MKGKVLVLLFALPFFLVGVWMLYSVGSNLTDAWQMRHWEPLQATLLTAGYETHDGDDTDTYEAYARYTYEFGGQQFSASRVSIAGGSDNIGDYQTDLGSRLSQTMVRGDRVTVYVNANNPSMAVIDRSVRWGLIGFKSIFLFVFGGVGLALIIFTLRAPKQKDQTEPRVVAHPWLINDAWQTATITSNSRSSMAFAWVFAAIWNLISAPLPFIVYREFLENDNVPALLGLLFPLVGMGLLAWAIRRSLEWRRFGPAPMTLDPFPGSIGGHVGGTIDVNLPYDSNNQFSMTLTNLHSYVSRSGKDRSRRERAKWQDTQVAHATSGSNGSRLSFRFSVPAALSESAADRSEDDYYIWRLNVKASLPGIDIDRDYEIPVYATGQESERLSDFSIDQAKTAQSRIDRHEIEKLIEVSPNAGSRSILFPLGRNLLSALGGSICGSVFAGVGWFLLVHENHVWMGSIFGLVGMIIVASAFYFALNSLEVTKEVGELRTIRRILGVPVRHRQMRISDFVRFSKRATSTTQSGSKHVIRYSISAVDRQQQSMVVGEGFRGVSQADAAAEFIGQHFGLVEKEGRAVDIASSVDEYNFLAAE